jgi:peptide/nickel transport system substrate-binding protein
MRSMCSAPANEIDVCPNALLAGDFPDGQAVLDTAFNGRMIRPHANKNWGQVDSPNVNAAIEREAQLRSNPLREQGWAAVDNGLVVYAVAIPYAWTSEPAIESRDVSGVGDLWNAGAWDYSFTSLR